MWSFALILQLSAVAATGAGDVSLETLVRASLEGRPELAQRAAEARAARERVPQASTFADPTLQVAVQNDSFNRWQVGTMETSWVSFMASQTFLFPGKRALREAVASREVELVELSAERVRLGVIADVRRAYLALQLVRAQQPVLERRIALLGRLVEGTRLRLSSPDGLQADVLRAQVELGRAKQQQLLLARDVSLAVQTLNRLRGAQLDAAVETAPLPAMPEALNESEALALTLEHSPELLMAKAQGVQATDAVSLARREALPDFSVSAGVMVRGKLDPMWTVALSVPVPSFSVGRQEHAEAEASARREAASRSLEAMTQALTLATHQRAASLVSLRLVAERFEGNDGLLAQSTAAAESMVTAFGSGRLTLSAALEVQREALDEVESSLALRAEAWRLVIAQDELGVSP